MLKNHRALAEVILIAALFSTSFIFVKIAVVDIPPITLIALRVTIAGLILYGLLKLKKGKLSIDFKTLKHCFILGFFANGFPFVCFSISLTEIPTSISALINGMTPVMTVFLAHLFLKDEPLKLNTFIGVVLGIGGFAVLFVPTLMQQEMNFNIFGITLCFIGSCSYAVGAIYTKKYIQNTPFLVAPTLQLLTSSIYLIPIAFMFETPMVCLSVPVYAWACVLGLSIFGTAIGFIIYHRIVMHHGVTALSMSTYLLPIFGTLWGVTLLGETLSPLFMLSACLILTGIAVINGIIRLPLIRPASPNT